MSNREHGGANARRLAAFSSLLACMPRELSFRDSPMAPEPSRN